MNYKELINNIKEVHIVNYIMYDVKLYNYIFKYKEEIEEILFQIYSEKDYNIKELTEYILDLYFNYQVSWGDSYHDQSIFKNDYIIFNNDYYYKCCDAGCMVDLCKNFYMIKRKCEIIYNLYNSIL